MKFQDKYPRTDYLEEVEPGIIREKEFLPCWHCGELNMFVEMDFEAPLCSEECSEAKVDECHRASIKGDVSCPPCLERTGE